MIHIFYIAIVKNSMVKDTNNTNVAMILLWFMKVDLELLELEKMKNP